MSRRARFPAWAGATALSLLLVLLNLLAWRWAHAPLPAAAAELPLAGLAYNGFARWQSPLEQQRPEAAEVEQDLKLLSGMTARLRTYSAAEMPQLPAIAERLGMKLTAGVWLERRADRNERELQAIEVAVREHRSIERVIAGNETLLHGVLTVDELRPVLERLRASLGVPVSTAEPWHVWLAEPELVEAVDFIAVHLLPYWEGVPAEVAVHEVWRRHDELRQRYPHKPLVIAEVGWPSGGAVIEKRVAGALNRAGASAVEQARFLREFVASARQRAQPVDYFIMEAVDQPWKAQTEGAAGPHWGVLDARRQAKFGWSGPVERDPWWRGKALAAGLIGLLVLWPVLLKFPHMRLSGRLAYGVAAQVVATLVVVLMSLPLFEYLRVLDAVLMALLAPALVLMAAILLSQVFEFAELFWDGSLRSRTGARPWSGTQPAPMVSIHLACCNEPPEMVLATVRSLQRLRWPNLEIIVVDNNTTDDACWQPVSAFVEAQRAAGDQRLRFMRLENWPGYKAGALNEALRCTDPQAQWVGVVDADYVVDESWLERLAGHFEDPQVGVVQSPQAHREWSDGALSRMMNWEYEGFFRLGMHHRQERNAIVQHGTMTLIRAQALRAVGGWETSCVCEDTELGLRLLRSGWRKVYVDEVMGTGLVPHDFAAYQRQRERWARGGMQILKLHADALFGHSALTRGQRYHFVAGWLPWIGDTLHLVFTVTALAWSVGHLVEPALFPLPLALFAMPLVVFFMARLLLSPLLYLRRVKCPPQDVLGAAWAGMALSHRIARGVLAGLLLGPAVFHVTRKRQGFGPDAQARVGGLAGLLRWRSVWQEALLLLALMAVALGIAFVGDASQEAGRAWLLVLSLQAIPYAAALSCAALSGPRRGGDPAAA